MSREIKDIFKDQELIDLCNNNIELTSKLNEVNLEIVNKFKEVTKSDEIDNEEKIFLAESFVNKGEYEVFLNDRFEDELYNEIVQFNKLKESIDEKKALIKNFLEENGMGTFETSTLKIKYTSATTATTIDTTRLKKELPDIAAKYSKVSARSSSLSIEPIE